MKTSSRSLAVLVLTLFSLTATYAGEIIHIVKDANKMNALFNALGGPGWKKTTGWPVPSNELTAAPVMPEGCAFVTKSIKEGENYRYEYYLRSFSTNDDGARGSIPSVIEFDSLQSFEVSHDTVTGSFPTFNCPKLESITFVHVPLTGPIPNYSSATLKYLWIMETGATGGFPTLNAPNLESLTFSQNIEMTGPIGKVSAPKLKRLSFSGNTALAGQLFPLDFPLAVDINIGYNTVMSGSINTLSFPDATGVHIYMNGIDGTLPSIQLPNVGTLEIRGNKLAGGIPRINAPKADLIDLSENLLDGAIEAQSMPLLRYFRINNNKLSGPIPELDLPALIEFRAGDNRLTGDLTTLARLPKLKKCIVSKNALDGKLPSEWTSSDLTDINVSNNQLTGNIPSWSLTQLASLDLGYNKLSGKVPAMSYPALLFFDVSGNQLSGAVGTPTLPSLITAYLSSNKLSWLPNYRATCPKINTLWFYKNRVGFGSVERNIGISSIEYRDQDTTQLYSERIQPNKALYYIKLDGDSNQYQWYRWTPNPYPSAGLDPIDGANNDSLVVADGDTRPVLCIIRNSLVTDLIIYSKRQSSSEAIPNPYKIGLLSFLASASEGWEVSEESPTISTSGSVSINDLLWFDGTIEIDTEAVSITANGVFSLKNVPIPGGGIGTFVVSEGKYELKLLGADGRITEFANSALSKLPKIAGISLSLSEIKLLGGATADGISMSGAITIDGLSNGCHEDEPGPTTIAITDLAYTRSEGFSVGGMKVENLGFSKYPKFCVKELSAEYDRAKNKLSFGASIAMPYAEVSGGMALIGTAVDSIAWRLEATEHAVPLGNTNMGMSGFFGSISGIQANELDATLGGVFVTMIPKDFVKFDLAGTYKAPATIGALIDGVAIPTPGEDDQYQLKLKGATNYDFAEGKAHLEGEAHIGTADGDEYFVDGAMSIDMKTSTLALKGSISGGYQMKPFGDEDADEYPYDWINAKLGLPKKFATEANFVFVKSRILFGIAHLGPGLGDIEYSFDFTKNWRHADFLNWKRIPATEELRGGSGEIATTRNVIVPDNATRMVVRVKGASTLPASTLTMPNGTTVSGTDVSKQIDYTVASGNKKAFWTVLEPSAGRWTINAPSAATGDIIEIFVDALPAPFTFTHTQQNRNVTLTWTPQGNVDDSIAFFVVGTGTTADGLDLGSAALMSGTKTITIPMDLPVCTFNIEAQGTRGMTVVSDTSATQVSVQSGTVTAPSMMLAKYFTGQKLLNITWTPAAVNDKNVKSYVIHARNAGGEERLLGEAFRWVGWVSVPYTRQNGDKITVRGVDANGRMGCPTDLSNITTDVEELTADMSDKIQIIPHPVNQRAEAHFWNTTAGVATVSLVDLQGRRVTTLYNGYVDAGPVVIGVDGSAVPSGVYTMLIRINDDAKRIPLVIAR